MNMSKELAEGTISTMSALSPAERKRLLELWEKKDPQAREQVIHERRRRFHAGMLWRDGKLH